MTAPAPRSHRWVDAVRLQLRRLASEAVTPPQVGVAVAVGILIGTTPLYGLHGLLSLAVATLLRLNRMITFSASNYSIPPLYPFIVFGSVQIGSVVTRGRTIPLSMDALSEIDVADFGVAWVVGAPLLGVAVGVPAGLLAYGATRWHRARADEADELDGDSPP